MKLAFLLLFVGLTSSIYQSPPNNEKLIITNDFFSDENKVYEGKHDIVKICVPLNKLNFNEDASEEYNDDVLLFFVEADGGLYVKKGNAVTKLLDHGRDVAAPHDENSNVAYFAAKDGLYVYNSEENKAEKYGTISDDLIGVTIGHSTDEIYVLSADLNVYKIFENGNKKVLILTHAQQIMCDNSNHLYYVDTFKNIHVVKGAERKQIVGELNYSRKTLIKPPFIYDEGIPSIINSYVFKLHPNDIIEDINIMVDTDVSAFAPEAFLIQFYGKNKKIYQYNLLPLVLGTVEEQLSDFHD